MKNKMIIAIITVLICISAIVGAVQHFGNDKKENSNLISTDASAEHTTAEEETSLSAVSQEVQNTSALSESESESNSQAKSTAVQTSASRTAGTTKQQTTTAPNTIKTQTSVKKTEKPNITVTVSINCKTALKYGADVPQSEYF